jgi:C4-dicarboxylate-binding protein DctP
MALEAIRKSGKTAIHVPTPAEAAAWRKALLPVHKDMESRIGKDLLNAIAKDANK